MTTINTHDEYTRTAVERIWNLGTFWRPQSIHDQQALRDLSQETGIPIEGVLQHLGAKEIIFVFRECFKCGAPRNSRTELYDFVIHDIIDRREAAKQAEDLSDRDRETYQKRDWRCAFYREAVAARDVCPDCRED